MKVEHDQVQPSPVLLHNFHPIEGYQEAPEEEERVHANVAVQKHLVKEILGDLQTTTLLTRAYITYINEEV